MHGPRRQNSRFKLIFTRGRYIGLAAMRLIPASADRGPFAERELPDALNVHQGSVSADCGEVDALEIAASCSPEGGSISDVCSRMSPASPTA